MCKSNKRAIRRHLTRRYSKRQVALYAQVFSSYEATQRRRHYNYFSQNSINCGNARCCFCMNDRRNPWHTKQQRLTLQERKSDDSFNDQLNEVSDSKLNWLELLREGCSWFDSNKRMVRVNPQERL